MRSGRSSTANLRSRVGVVAIKISEGFPHKELSVVLNRCVLTRTRRQMEPDCYKSLQPRPRKSAGICMNA